MLKAFSASILAELIALDETDIVVRLPHAAPAAARHRLDHDRIADLLGDLKRLLIALHDAVAARRNRHAGFAGGFARDGLVAHGADRGGLRTDELDVAAFADLGEMGVLGQEPVAGMDGIDIADLRRADDAIDFEITLLTGGFTDTDRLVGELHMERIDIRRRIDRQRLDPKFLAGADDAQSNLAAIGDEYLIKHGARDRRNLV